MTYLAHDLDDPSVWRRVDMLRRGGAQVTVAGFRRGDAALAEPATVLGRTANGRMAQRAGAVAKALPRIGRLVPDDGGDVVLARNLEMLALGSALLQQRGRAGGRLVYELLDIHGMMLGDGIKQRVMRRIEARLLRRTRLTVISSPAFQTQYLARYDQPEVPTLLIENKPFAGMARQRDGAAPGGIEQGGPLRIGWFGMLRCRWSLDRLDAVTRADPGRFNVTLRGRPALDVMPEFHDVIGANPDLAYLGEYAWPGDLAGIYADVDVAWLIDRYQAGQNSDWLLPNRLYEGCLNGAVPVVLDGTQVAARVADWRCGVAVPGEGGDPSARVVGDALAAIDAARVRTCRAAVAEIPRGDLEMDDAECRSLTAEIAGHSASAGLGLAAE